MTATQQAATSLTLTKFIKAPRRKVYEAWLRPEVLTQWMGGGRTQVPVFESDPRAGGKYHLEMQSPGIDGAPGKRYVVDGAYQELVPGEKLVFTWVSEAPHTGDSLITLLFKEKEGGTEMTLIHERLADVEVVKSHEKGWTGSLEKLVAVLER